MRYTFLFFLAIFGASVACMEPVNIDPTPTVERISTETATETAIVPDFEYAELDKPLLRVDGCMVWASSAHVREAATEHSPALGWVHAGTQLQILERNGDWGRVDQVVCRTDGALNPAGDIRSASADMSSDKAGIS